MIEVKWRGVRAPLRNHISVARDWWLQPLCRAGRHQDVRIRPGVYECQRSYCLRVRKVKAEMNPVVEARISQGLAELMERFKPIRERRRRS